MAYERYIEYLSKKLNQLDKKKLEPNQNLFFLEQLKHQVKAMMVYIKILKKKKHLKAEQLIEEHTQSLAFHVKVMKRIKEEQKKNNKTEYIEPVEIQKIIPVHYPYRLNIQLKPEIPKDVLYNELAMFQLEMLSLFTDENKPVYKAKELDFIFIDEPDNTISFRFSNKITAEMFITRLLIKTYITIPELDMHQSLTVLFNELQPESNLKGRLDNLFGRENDEGNIPTIKR